MALTHFLSSFVFLIQEEEENRKKAVQNDVSKAIFFFSPFFFSFMFFWIFLRSMFVVFIGCYGTMHILWSVFSEIWKKKKSGTVKLRMPF